MVFFNDSNKLESMKVTINKHLCISIEDMDPKETMAFINMVMGAGLEERRIFNGVLTTLTQTPMEEIERNDL